MTSPETTPPTGPPRLREDAKFLAAAGIRFEDEAAMMPRHDVAALRARLDANIEAGVPTVMPQPGPFGALGSLGAKAAAVAGTGVVVAGLVMWTMGGGGPGTAAVDAAETGRSEVEVGAQAVVEAEVPVVAVVEAPIEAPIEEPAEVAAEIEEAAAAEAEPAEVEEEATEVAGSNPTPAPTRRGSTPTERPTPEVAPAPRAVKMEAVAPAEVVEVEEPAVEVEPAPAVPTSTLAAQLALYEQGRESLRAGALSKATAAFEEYGRRYPTGELASEARLSLLEALVRAGKSARAERLAARLLASGGLGSRRGELLRVRGEQLVRLSRCDEAAGLLSQARSAGAITAVEVETAVGSCGAPQ